MFEVYAPTCRQGGSQEANVSDRRRTRWALDKEEDMPGLWIKRQTCRAMDKKEEDAPGWRRMLFVVDKEADGR